MSELVSIIITVYNGKDYLVEAIESVFKQTYTNWELILVDDGSKDDTLSIMESYASKDERITVLSHENKGISYSNNRALRIAKGKYYAKLDADDRMLPNRLEVQVKYLENHPEVTMLSCQAYYINSNGKRIGKHIVSGFTDPEESLEAKRTGRIVIAPHTGFTTYLDKVIEVDGYREELPCVVDLDLFCRMVALGNILIILPDLLVEYRMHLSSVMALATKSHKIQTIRAWVEDRYLRRAQGKPDLSLEEFKDTYDTLSEREKYFQRMKEQAYHHRRNSIVYYGDKQYLLFLYSIGMATLLQPAYTLGRVVAWFKRKSKK